MFNGFYVQDGGDGDVLTSDGIFVYGPGAMDVSVGNGVVVTGTVSEFNGITEISLTGLAPCDAPFAVAATPVTLPEAVNDDLERYEGMLVTFPQTLTVDQNYFQGRFGEVTLSSDGRMYNPTNGNGLGDTVDLDARRMIVLDDGLSGQNPNPIPYIGADNTMRAGDTVVGLTGVVDYGLISSDGTTRDYKIQPVGPVAFTRVNNRTAAPDPRRRQPQGRQRQRAELLHHFDHRRLVSAGHPTTRTAAARTARPSSPANARRSWPSSRRSTPMSWA